VRTAALIVLLVLSSAQRIVAHPTDDSTSQSIIEDIYDFPSDVSLEPDETFEYMENIGMHGMPSLEEIHALPQLSWISAYRSLRASSFKDSTRFFSLRTRGGLPMDASSQSGALDNKYLGTPASIYNKLRASSAYLAASVLEQKKAWEPHLADKLSGFVMLRKPIELTSGVIVERAIFGDYALAFGNGLLFGSGVAIHSQRNPTHFVEERAFSLRGSLSENPFMKFRGAAIGVSTGAIHSVLFASDRPITSNIINDTIQTIYQYPYYRTIDELALKNAARLHVLGLHSLVANSDSANVHLATALTAYDMRYSLPYAGTPSSPFYGKTVYAGSIDALIVTDKLSASVEGALSVSDSIQRGAAMASVRFEPSQNTAVGLYYRYIPYGFVSPFGEVTGSPISSVANSNGLYASAEFSAAPHLLRITGYAAMDNGLVPTTDLFVKQKSDYLLAIYLTPANTGLEFSTSVRTRSEQHTGTNESTATYFTLTEDRTNMRVELRYNERSLFSVHARYEYIHYKNSDASSEQGWLVSGSARILLESLHVTLSANASRFVTAGFNSALYLYQSSVPGSGGGVVL
jgi:hypothetical protein